MTLPGFPDAAPLAGLAGGALIGLAVAIALQARRVPGSVLAGIIVAALVGVPLGLTRFDGVFSLPHSPAPVTGKVDMLGAISLVALPYMFTFFASEFFSTLGTTLAIGGKAGLTDTEGNLPQIERPFLIDSLAATLGPLVGVPGGTALVESAAGVEAGGRTGMTPMVAAILFAATLLAMPLAMAIPREATAPALILIGIAMMGTIRQAPGEDTISLFAPIAMMLLTLISNSFGTGIAGGLLVHVLVEVLAGRWRQIPVGLFVLSLPLGYYFYTAATLH